MDFFPDQYETAGDNGFQTSNIIKPNNVFQYHTFNHEGDVDYLALDLTGVAKGNVLHITTSINTKSTKTVLTLFDAQQKALISDRKISRESYSSLYFIRPAPDIYYLKIACPQSQNLNITVNIEVKDIIHSNNTMTFQYQIPARYLMY